jgi:hypothetical protein
VVNGKGKQEKSKEEREELNLESRKRKNEEAENVSSPWWQACRLATMRSSRQTLENASRLSAATNRT